MSFFFSYLSSFLKLKGVIYLEISIVFIHVHFLDDLEKKKKERKEEKKKKSNSNNNPSSSPSHTH